MRPVFFWGVNRMDLLLVLQKKLNKLESRIATLEPKAKTFTDIGAINQMKFLAREYRRNIASLIGG